MSLLQRHPMLPREMVGHRRRRRISHSRNLVPKHTRWSVFRILDRLPARLEKGFAKDLGAGDENLDYYSWRGHSSVLVGVKKKKIQCQPVTFMSQLAPTQAVKRKRVSDVDEHAKRQKKPKIAREEKNKREGEFMSVKATLPVSIAPVFAGNPRAGVEEMLDSMVMRYIPAFRGVVLAHSDLHFLNNTAVIKGDCPYLICNVAFETTLWSPNVGMKLVGRINLCSPDHISLLVHRTFNASIPRHHIPVDEWEFEYDPMEAFAELEEDDSSHKDELPSGGRWVHKVTGERLGGEEGYLEFTIIGLMVANEMLSLLGSIQFDPFSPDHVPERLVPVEQPSDLVMDDSSDHESDASPPSARQDNGRDKVGRKEKKKKTKESKSRKKDRR